MKFTLDSRSDIYLIRGYGPGEVRIGELVHHAPCIVTAQQLVLDWEVRDVASLQVADLDALFVMKPDVVLLGTGARQIYPQRAIRQAFITHKVGLEVMNLGAACRTYNILVQEERRVAAVLFPAG
jgi:uncharacterized protein